MTKDDFLDILTSHRKWVESEGKEGRKADLHGVDLHGLELSGYDLSGVNLRGANLQGVNFGEANLHGANLQEADLQEAHLSEAKGLLARQLAGANVSGAELPKDIASFDGLKYVDAASSHAQKLFFSLLLVCVYCWLTIATTTDAGLITNFAESPLPIINTKISIVWFYWAAPLLLVCFYLYFQIYLQRLWEALADLPAVFPDGRALPHRIHPWLLNGFAWAFLNRLKDERPPLSRVQNFLAIILAWWLVPFTLFAFWLRYLRAHELITTYFHYHILTLAIGGAIGFSFLTTTTFRLKEKRLFSWKHIFIDERIYKRLAILLGIVVIGVGFSLLSSRALQGRRLYHHSLYDADLKNAEVSLKPPNWTGENKKEEIALVKGAFLLARNLRYARARGAFFVKAVLVVADLQQADLEEANFQEAILINANLREANLRYSNLEGADLKGAKLQRAELYRANLSKANLQEADLRGADLKGAEGLTREQIETAITDETTKLPDNLK